MGSDSQPEANTGLEYQIICGARSMGGVVRLGVHQRMVAELHHESQRPRAAPSRTNSKARVPDTSVKAIVEESADASAGVWNKTSPPLDQGNNDSCIGRPGFVVARDADQLVATDSSPPLAGGERCRESPPLESSELEAKNRGTVAVRGETPVGAD